MFDFIGDTHFRSSKEWDRAAFTDFLDWWDTFTPAPNSILFHCGDVFDAGSADGNTMDMAKRFFSHAAEVYEHIYVIGGNHDIKVNENYKAYLSSFLSLNNKITVVTEPAIMDVYGKTIMFLPHVEVAGGLVAYINDGLPKEFYTTNVDYCVGHSAIEIEGSLLEGFKTQNFPNVKHFIMGHVHSPSQSPDIYVGSAMPMNIKEQSHYGNRLMSFSENDVKSLIPIPVFKVFKEVNYEDGMKDLVSKTVKPYTIYKVINSPLSMRESDFPDIFINKFEKKLKQDNSEITAGEGDITNLNPWEVYNEMVEEQGMVVSRAAEKILKEILTKE